MIRTSFHVLCARAAIGLLLIAAAGADPGLVGVYRDGRVEIQEVVPGAAFRLAAEESLHPALSPDFEASYSGRLTILRNGEYVFYAEGGEVRIDGAPASEPIRLEPGERRLQVRYQRAPGAARLRLEWEGPGFLREPVPGRLLSHDPADGPTPRQERIARGRRLAEDLGCANCHDAGASSLEARPAPVLTLAGDRLKPAWLRAWMLGTDEVSHAAAMPEMLTAEERADAAAYLATLTGAPELETRYSHDAEERGRAAFRSLGCVACHDSGGVSLDGLGSKTTAGHLAEFLRKPSRLFPDGRMPSFRLDEEEALDMAAYLMLSTNPRLGADGPAGDAKRGEAVVRSSGCLACHSLEGAANTATAPDLSGLRPDAGCLADEPGANVPRYRLDEEDRAALREFVGFYAEHPDRSPAPVHAMRSTLDKLRCNQCHEVDGQAAQAAAAKPAPSLTGVGDKLRREWFEHVLSEESRTFEGFDLRMPNYPVHADALADGFMKSSGAAEQSTEPSASAAARDRGHGMLGVDSKAGGMGCIGCHGWDPFPPLGESGPRVDTVAKRMRYDWFERWMRDPARIFTGTSMPNYFAATPAAEAHETIDALWAAFRGAEELPPPAGFEVVRAVRGSEAMPDPVDRAIVIRWSMPESTAAAIAVGLPGEVSYCFDAAESRLRYAWRGGFVDMTPTLMAKKNKATGLTETAHLVGEIFYREAAFPLRVGDSERIPKRRFRGYELVDSYPRFHYQVDGVDVFEAITPLEDGRGLLRRFTLPRVDRPMWFVFGAESGASVGSSLGDPADGRLAIPVGRDIEFDVTVTAP